MASFETVFQVFQTYLGETLMKTMSVILQLKCPFVALLSLVSDCDIATELKRRTIMRSPVFFCRVIIFGSDCEINCT